MKFFEKVAITDLVFILLAVAFLFFLFAPKQVYPIHGMTIVEQDFNFEIENAEEVVISVNEDFTDVIFLSVGDSVTLPPGVYFWKVRNKFMESDVKNFTIDTSVALSLIEKNKILEIVNVGNVDAAVSNGSLNFSLSPGESQEIENDSSTYVGVQNE